jgi:hypothetical protein
MTEEDYYPWEINYSQKQIRWLLGPIPWTAIKFGQWPFCIRDDIAARTNTSHHAPFELISLIKAELEVRLDSIGRDKYILLARFNGEWSDRDIAYAFNIDINRIGRRTARAMRYISGRRKRASYDNWIKNGWKERERAE